MTCVPPYPDDRHHPTPSATTSSAFASLPRLLEWNWKRLPKRKFDTISTIPKIVPQQLDNDYTGFGMISFLQFPALDHSRVVFDLLTTLDSLTHYMWNTAFQAIPLASRVKRLQAADHECFFLCLHTSFPFGGFVR